jgi:hypothetical protein
MGEYENQYRALEREGDAACEEIKRAIEEIKNSQDEIKQCEKRITSLQQKRQNVVSQQSQQSSLEVEDKSSHFDMQLTQTDKEINENGNKITFLLGKISSLKTKQSENENKLNEFVNKLTELKSRVSKEKADFNSSFRGIKSEATQIKSKDSSDARRDLESSASKAHSMHQKRVIDEKEIENIIKKLKGCAAKSANNISYSGAYQVSFTGGKQPNFNSIPMVTLSKNKDEINKAIMNVKSSSIDNLFPNKIDSSSIERMVGEINSPVFMKRSLHIYGNQIVDRSKEKDWSEEYYYYKKNKSRPSFNPYYDSYTKSHINNNYRQFEYKF